MSAEKDDAQIIDTDSEMWGYLSQSDKFKKPRAKKRVYSTAMIGVPIKF